MNNNFIKGVLISIGYYTIGIVVAFLVYLIFGWNYKHAPGLHHISSFFVYLGGIGLILYGARSVLKQQNDLQGWGLLLTNLIVTSTVTILFFRAVKQETAAQFTPKMEDNISFTLQGDSKTFVGVNGLGDTVYKKIGDSVIINQIARDSASTNYRQHWLPKRAAND